MVMMVCGLDLCRISETPWSSSDAVGYASSSPTACARKGGAVMRCSGGFAPRRTNSTGIGLLVIACLRPDDL